MATDPDALVQNAIVAMAHTLELAAGADNYPRVAEILARLTAAVAIAAKDPREFLSLTDSLAGRYAAARPPPPDWRALVATPDGKL